MTTGSTAAQACRSWLQRWRVRRHFARRISPRAERALRLHLAGCDDCRDYYDGWLRFSELDPEGAAPLERLGVGLGLVESRRSVVPPLLLVAATCACTAFIWLRTAHNEASEFAARGGVVARAATSVRVYRAEGHTAMPVLDSIQRSDELSFAYLNPKGYRYLLVFGVDERGQVFWYYPAWTDPQATPASVPIDKSTGLVELPDAIRHDLSGNRLKLLAIFGNVPLSVRAVEDRLSSQAAREGPLFADTFEQELLLEVR